MDKILTAKEALAQAAINRHNKEYTRVCFNIDNAASNGSTSTNVPFLLSSELQLELTDLGYEIIAYPNVEAPWASHTSIYWQ